MSPFMVDTTQDKGSYQATSTLAGTRINTDLKDLASSLSVVTAQFLQDTGATNNESLLVYTTNTEIAGVKGNYGAVGGIYVNGAAQPQNVNPGTNNRVRGLDSADMTRDYFATDIPWDSFDVGRIDMQRGPNSILFGIGSPAGIINANVNMATFTNSYKLEDRYGSFGSFRNSLDFNQVILPNELSFRIALLDDDTKFRQQPAFDHQRRIYGALRYDPKFLNTSKVKTTLRANFEHGNVTANRPNETPPDDLITPFFNQDGKTTYDPYFAWITGVIPQSTGVTKPLDGQTSNFYLQQGMANFTPRGGPILYYNPDSGAPIFTTGPGPGGSGNTTYYALGPTGAIDHQIDGYPYSAMFNIAGYSAWAVLNNLYNPTDPATLGAASGFYKDKVLTDRSIFNFYDNLLQGPTQGQLQGWDAFNITLDQSFVDNRFGYEVAFDKQNYHDGQHSTFGNLISVDVLANTYEAPWPYSTGVQSYNGTGTPGTNPNAGRPYTAGDGTASSDKTSREDVRITAFAELRATDFLKKSWLSDFLGRHVFTGLYSKDVYDKEQRYWDLQATDMTWPDDVGNGPAEGGSNALSTGDRNVDMISYLGGPLFGDSSAHGLNLQPISAIQAPSGPINAQYFNSNWKWSLNPADPNYVNPGAPWTNPASFNSTNNNGGLSSSTQSENPANYVGWTNATFNILSANNPADIDSLYTAGNKIHQVLESKALTWQGFLWDDTLAATVGWRRDTQEEQYGNAPISAATGAASMNYGLQPLQQSDIVSGNSKSWGLVLHEPKFLRNKLPWGTNISLTYDIGNNTRVESRYGFDGNPLPNATGHTKDYGFVINTLNDRLTLKVTRYLTTVDNANMSSNPGTSVLGANAYYLYNMEIWGLADALTNLAGIAGQASGEQSFWDWAAADNGNTALPPSAAFLNDPSTVKEKAASLSFLAQLQPQSWWDAYGYPVNVANAKAGNWNTAIGNWNPSDWIWGVSNGNQGLVHGVVPTGTIDDQSKGVEIELTGQVTKNWNISANASKQTAEQTSLGASISNFINDQYAMYQSPAGDLRLWWATDMTLRQYYQANIYATYQFLQGSNGTLVPEMSPWRCNIVTNYSFDHGFVKGANVGLGYRWQQGQIIGYGLLPDYSNLDVNKPIWGKSVDALDLWAGYERKLGPKLRWRIQLNVQNFMGKAHLMPVSVEPDGTPALQRIVEGQTWFVTNSLTF
jgi:outer membrane receptor protein involved in Fe transport